MNTGFKKEVSGRQRQDRFRKERLEIPKVRAPHERPSLRDPSQDQQRGWEKGREGSNRKSPGKNCQDLVF